MVALTSVLRDRWVTTRAFYSASFCRRKADGSTDSGPFSRAEPCEFGMMLSEAFVRTSNIDDRTMIVVVEPNLKTATAPQGGVGSNLTLLGRGATPRPE